MRPAVVLLAMLVVAMGGCAAPDGDEDAEDPLPGPPDPAPRRTVFYLNAAPGLQRSGPSKAAPDAVAAPGFYRAWAQGEDQPTFLGAPLGAGLVVHAATLTFYYTSDEGVATTGPGDAGFPEFVVYFGSPEAPMAWASVEGPDVVAPGEVVEIEAVLEVPRGGLVLPSGRAPAVVIAPVQAQADEGVRLNILVNGTDAESRIELSTGPVTFPTQGASEPGEVGGRLVGSAYVLGADERTTAARHAFDVGPGVTAVHVRLERTSGVGVADIDLEVLAPNGTVVARSVTPMPHEGVDLYAPNLAWGGTGSWSARVVNYGHVVVEYRVTITTVREVLAA